jgi:hypothetical protein
VVAVWVVAVLCGVGGFVLFISDTSSSVVYAAPGGSFRSGATSTVTVEPGDGAAVYIATDQKVNFRCSIDGSDKVAKLNGSKVARTVTANGVRWEHILDIGVTESGSYKVTCATEPATDARFGVGRNPAAVVETFGGTALALVLVPAVAFVIAVVVTVIVLVRRNGARRRLAAG